MSGPPSVFSVAQRGRRRSEAGGRWVVIGIALLLLAGFDQLARRYGSRYGLPGGSAAWIWTTDSPREVVPRAFYLLKDFDLDSVPNQARLLVGGDAEYVLFLNGFRVGANAYHPGALLDFYQVAALLRPGGNRFVAELRSSQGVGGFFLHLDSGEGGDALVETDRSWLVVREMQTGLVAGWWSPQNTGVPRSWARPPTARWGSALPGPERPIFPPLDRPFLPLAATAVERPGDADGAAAGGYRPFRFDLGSEAVGYLRVRFEQPTPAPALLFVGSRPPEPSAELAAVSVLLPTGARLWRDAELRRLRYVTLVSRDAVASVELIPVEPAQASRLASQPIPQRGVFGIRAFPRLTPLELEIRAGLGASGKDPS